MILYNGASGGIGRYLAESLRRRNEDSYALKARLEDQEGLAAELGRLDPAAAVTFIHLAARVSVPACEADPAAAHQINVVLARATVEKVLDWASRHGANARVIFVSSGHVYSAQPEGTRVTEGAPTLPRSVYAETKLAAEHMLEALASPRGVPLLVARVFGLIAPRQAPNYLLPALIERVRTGRLEGIPGLDFARDYLDARDVCEDLLLLSAAPWPAPSIVVNVCSGVPVTIRDVLFAVLHELEPAQAADIVREATPAAGRPGDARWLVGDPGRFVELTGQLPRRIPLATTVSDAVARAIEPSGAA